MNTLIWIGATIVALAIGSLIGYQLRKVWALKRKDTVEAKVETLINEAKSRQKEILLEANDKALKVLEEAKLEAKEKDQEINRTQQRLEKREGLFDQKLLELESKKQELIDKAEEINKIKEQVNTIKEEQLQKLEKIAGMDKEDAKKILISNVEQQSHEDLLSRMQKLGQESAIEIDKKAKEVLSLAIMRTASSHSAETSTSTVNIPNDEMKGRIIGREGRNIKTFEQLTGVEIIVDDTPNAITISGFSPIRRQVAKRALERLIVDGRIQPARIEDAITESKKELAVEITKAGEEALYKLGITGIDPKLVQILGRLKFRTSYGQNILHHSIEVTYLAGLLAEMLGADVAITKKGALFHDIGKAVDHEVTGGHPQIGYDILKKFGVSEEVAYCAQAHHDDVPNSLECIIVKTADAISGARPGARKETFDQYIQRLEELENVAKAFDGIDKVYAIQAGREVRVFVMPDVVDDFKAVQLARDIARKIEAELKFPGEIKVTIIRESRVIEYAR